MHYSPEGTRLKDAWQFVVGDEVHCVYMQEDNLDCEDDRRSFCTLGQAASADLISWRPLPTALQGGPAGTYDDKRLHTGTTIEVEGVYYMFYTATGSAQGGFSRIALATSRDGLNWQKHAQNPLITPDPRHYYSEEAPIELRCHGWPIVDCRDFAVVADPEGDGFWGFFAARRRGTECAETAVIALCHSADLIHWKQHPPCFAPERYACIEVPDVFLLDGRWYMLCLTGNAYGQRHVMAEPNLVRGTIYAVADDIRGPYREPQENVLIGSTGPNGFACRTVEWGGRRHLLYTHQGALSLPVVLRTDGAGGLLPCYYAGLDDYLGEHVVESVTAPALPHEGRWGSIGVWRHASQSLRGSCRTDWALHVYEGAVADCVYAVDVHIHDAQSAGLAFRIQGDDVRGGCYAALLDADAGEVILTRPRSFKTLDKRRLPVRRNRTYRLKCVAAGAILNLYVDDVLVLQASDPEFSEGRCGLFVERGAAEFSGLSVRRLCDTAE